MSSSTDPKIDEKTADGQRANSSAEMSSSTDSKSEGITADSRGATTPFSTDSTIGDIMYCLLSSVASPLAGGEAVDGRGGPTANGGSGKKGAALSDANDGCHSEFEDGTDQSAVDDQQQLEEFRENFARMEMELKNKELENKLLQAELREQKLLAERNALQAKVDKPEQEQQQQKEDNNKGESVSLDQFNAILARIGELEKEQNEQREGKESDQQKAILERIGQLEIVERIGEIEKQQKQRGKESDQRKTILESIIRMEGVQQQQMTAFGQQLDILKEQIGKCGVAQTELCAKIDQLERKQTADFEQLKANYDAHFEKIDKKISLLLQNSWDFTACHDMLTITGPKCLGVHYKGDGKYGFGSVFAKHSILSSASDIFYFEIKVENVKGFVGIGLATKAMPLDDNSVGTHCDSYGYKSNGYYWINGFAKRGQPSFSAGDVVGCGVNLANRQIIFTKNGQRLDTSDLSILSPIDLLFPCVTLRDFGDKIAANFGPDFQFDIANV